MWKLISVMDLEQYIREEKPMILIDMREKESYDAGHIPQAVWVPGQKLEGYLLNCKYKNKSKQQEIILICYRGPTSIQAAKRLERRGISVSAVCGGMEMWEKLDKKITRP